MFESAEIGNTLSREAYEREMPRLRARLIELQSQLIERRSTEVLIVLAGLAGAGRSESAHLIGELFDPRHVQVVPDLPPNDEERCRPPMWRFWRSLPPKGRIGVFFSGWYGLPVIDRINRRNDQAHFDARLEGIKRFEQMAVDEGALVIKFWFHLGRKDQRKRLEALAADEDTAWRVTKEDWRQAKSYRRIRNVAERAVRETSTGAAPWFVIEGLDRCYREIAVARTLVDEISRVLAAQDEDAAAAKARPRRTPRRAAAKRAAPPPLATLGETDVLSALDLTAHLPKDDYREQLPHWQGRLARLSREKKLSRHGIVALFEGYDAAGKGGAIRRVAEALDPRFYGIVPIAAPSDEERAHPYLWRFWRHLPAQGRMVMFDRSWYGRVLVERVDGFAPEPVWRRAYAEINEFEQELVEHEMIIAKFFMVVSAAEQLERFRAREKVAFKRYKITPDDWHNREKRGDYDAAVIEMIQRTSTELAPWTLVEAEDKHHARIKVLRTLVETIERSLDR
ncbi:polyphosphate:AMP phosphotransferase [Zavarzinia compransoris]|uniref:Polyphosphate:AMP phosphotransferase n=1 Tax=Zavarzinia compransoris TaxID=1264899 RepID=A0A317EBA4_9PROT|nr:polyphosphate:AMP phosphotransferase [Zavarzinia compransoris]PWR23496.1 polyphosphate:AMP phosphotransferase [Zavarzinia compransoris]TDP45922.1 polyphosphate:AMP phosphotransferase [Zavarzinia compransoris]